MFPDVRRRCATRCRGAASSPERWPQASRRPPLRRSRRKRAPCSTVQADRRSHPHHVAGLPDLLRRAGDRDGEEVRPQEGRLQSLLVADHRACRHPSRRADSFLGSRRHRRQDRRRDAGGAACGRRRGGQGGAESRLSALARGSCGLGEEASAAAGQLLRRHAFRLGAPRRRSPRSTPARTHPAYSISPASLPRRPTG